MEKYRRDFIIAGIPIRLKTEYLMKMSGSFEDFAAESDLPIFSGYCAEFQEVQSLDIPSENPVYEEWRTSVHKADNDTWCRVFREYRDEKEAYAVAEYDWDNKVIQIKYLPKGKLQFDDVQKAFQHVAWEKILMNEGKMMLHASYVCTEFGGIAFSGISGIGKTTQAELWCKYGQGKMLNGDKIILEKKQGEWIGYGSPYAGSSKCYVNDSCKLYSLFFLKQGKTCSLRKLSVSESFKQIYSGLTLNRWDRDYVNRACDLAQQLAVDVPAYEFTCTPDEDAVYFLREKLQGGEKWNKN